VGLASGVALNVDGRAQAGMGVDSGDYDGDGRLDLILTAFAHDSNTLYHNRDGHSFEDATTETGLAGPTFVRMGWGTAFFDVDLDVVITNMDDVPTVLNNRQTTGHHWVAVQLRKGGRNRFCIGARVTVDAGGTRQVREIRSGGSYLSQGDLRAYYGLGSYAGVVDVEVR